jgi:hypothetical protein
MPKHYTSAVSFISTQQQSANVLETHLPRHFSSIVDISGLTRSKVVITNSAKMFGQKFRSKPGKRLLYVISFTPMSFHTCLVNFLP